MTQSSKRRLRRYDAKQRAEVLETARACGVMEARRRHGVMFRKSIDAFQAAPVVEGQQAAKALPSYDPSRPAAAALRPPAGGRSAGARRRARGR
jgi:hypothetical protein